MARSPLSLDLSAKQSPLFAGFKREAKRVTGRRFISKEAPGFEDMVESDPHGFGDDRMG